MRDSVVLYRSMYASLKALPAEMVKEALIAICEYAMDDKEPPEEGIGRAMVEQCRLVIDKNNKRYQNGTKGGRPKAKPEPTENQTETKEEPTDNQPITNEEPNQNQPETLKEKGERRKEKIINNIGRFTPPSVEDVKAYVEQMGYNVNAETFVDFYSSKGWMVGKNKMKDWKAAVRTWSRGDNRRQEAKSSNRFNNFHQRDYDFEDLERRLL